MQETIIIERGVIEWLRKKSGRSVPELSSFFQISEAEYLSYVTSATEFQPNKVQNTAEFLNCSLASLLLPCVPPDDTENIDTRLLTSTEGRITPEAWTEIKRAISDREEYVEISNDHFIPSFDIANHNFEEISSKTRQLLNLDSFPTSDYYTRLNLLRDKVESLGFLVFQRRIEGINLHEHCSGLCISSKNSPPIILINSRDVPQRRIFTVVHELIHFIMQNKTFASFEETERFCDMVTAEVLIEKSKLLKYKETLKISKSTSTEDLMKIVSYLAKRVFIVSRHSVMVRLSFLGIISRQQYEELMSAFKLNTDSWSELDMTGFVHPARQAIIEKGVKMNRSVLESLRNSAITPVHAEKVLGVANKYFGLISELLKKRS